MPVFTTLTGVPSNKQEEGGKGKKKVGKIRYEDISYIPIKGQVAVLKPIIDKISITYMIGDPGLKAVLVQNLKQETEAGGPWQSGAWKKGTVLYEASAQLAIPSNGHTVHVQVGPKKKTTTHTLRLEFNPTALGAPGIAFLKAQLEALVLDGLIFTDIITNGKVTRVDIAVDIIGIHLADPLLSTNSGGKQHWYLSAEGNSSNFFPSPNGGITDPTTTNGNERIDWFGTARARIGFRPANNWLLYGTGGLAYGGVKSSTTLMLTPIDDGNYAGSGSEVRVGWTAGVGGEYAFSNSWSAKLEYLYLDLGTTGVRMFDPGRPGTYIDYGFHHRDNIVRAGLNYHFGGPVVAKY